MRVGDYEEEEEDDDEIKSYKLRGIIILRKKYSSLLSKWLIPIKPQQQTNI